MPDEPTFEVPWHAHAFALVVALQDAGLVTAAEWAETLGAERASGDPAPEGTDDHYDDWVAALGRLLDDKQVATPEEIEALTESWQRAAQNTPHGHPIELANDPHP